jgi:hypothetical protein
MLISKFLLRKLQRPSDNVFCHKSRNVKCVMFAYINWTFRSHDKGFYNFLVFSYSSNLG